MPKKRDLVEHETDWSDFIGILMAAEIKEYSRLGGSVSLQKAQPPSKTGKMSLNNKQNNATLCPLSTEKHRCENMAL